ncbi:hypothetical protein HWV62_42329 [Athelia sp. TMB]|nr:hypothetical protein HWV62_42329 [Athelia sp. TMB]
MLVSATLESFNPSDAQIADGEAIPDPRPAQLLRSLLPVLKHLSSSTPASLYRPPPSAPAYQHLRARFSEKPKIWLAESLTKIQSQLESPEVKALRLGEHAKWVGDAVAKFVPQDPANNLLKPYQRRSNIV